MKLWEKYKVLDLKLIRALGKEANEFYPDGYPDFENKRRHFQYGFNDALTLFRNAESLAQLRSCEAWEPIICRRDSEWRGMGLTTFASQDSYCAGVETVRRLIREYE